MKISFWSTKAQVCLLMGLASPFIFQPTRVDAKVSTINYYNTIGRDQGNRIITIQKINPTTVEIVYDNGQRLTLDFYGNHIFRMFQDVHGGIIRDPEAKPEAKILVEQPRKTVTGLEVKDEGNKVSISTNDILFSMDKQTSQFSILNRKSNKIVVESLTNCFRRETSKR
jgi:hypothetical protein